MKRIALIACCLFVFGCGEDPEESGPVERAPDHLGISPGNAPPGDNPDDGDDEDDDSTDGAQDCGDEAAESESGSSHKPVTTRPLVPAAPGSVCTEGDDE